MKSLDSGDLPVFLNLTAASRRIGLSVPTLRAAVDNGEIPTVTIGRRRYIEARILANLGRETTVKRLSL